jgi:nephrocystin-3
LENLTSRKWKQLRVEPLTENEMLEFIEEYMAQYGKTLTRNQLDKVVSAKQSQNPLFLKTLLEELRIFGEFEQLDKKIEHYLLATTPPQLFESVFQRLEIDFENEVSNIFDVNLSEK